MLNPKQVSDFHADAWFGRSRRLKSASHRSRARGGRPRSRPRARAGRGRKQTAGVFYAEFLYGGDRSFYEYGKLQVHANPVSQTAVQNSYWFGRKKLPRPIFPTISRNPVPVY